MAWVYSDGHIEIDMDASTESLFPLQFPAQLPHNAVSLLMAEGAPHNALDQTLGDYGLPSVEQQKGSVRGLKTKVPEEELTRVQKMRRESNKSRSEKRREGGLWDPNVDGGGILQSGSAIRYYTLGHIGQHKGADGKYLGVADLPWLVKMLNALKDTDGYPCCSISGMRFTWNSDGEWPFSLNRIGNKDPSHGEDNVEVISARCNAVQHESHGAGNLRTHFTKMFKQMRREFDEQTLELAAERLKDEEDVIARVQAIFTGGSEHHSKRIFANILLAVDNDAKRNGWSNAHIKAFKDLFGGYNGLLCCESLKKVITQRGRCAYTGILLNGSLTSPFCLSLERLDNEICHFPLKLDKFGKPTVDFTNVAWIVRLIQVSSSWSRRIALTALLSSPTLERTREQEKLIMDALSAALALVEELAESRGRELSQMHDMLLRAEAATNLEVERSWDLAEARAATGAHEAEVETEVAERARAMVEPSPSLAHRMSSQRSSIAGASEAGGTAEPSRRTSPESQVRFFARKYEEQKYEDEPTKPALHRSPSLPSLVELDLGDWDSQNSLPAVQDGLRALTRL
ncbi:hypothetical protein T492DRAFT_857391 [Pavlovales sp. CCMP2436]|nr:hypothetical protein T492DRAFT_857391 [Pavlovales sp. CCMP2436]